MQGKEIFAFSLLGAVIVMIMIITVTQKSRISGVVFDRIILAYMIVFAIFLLVFVIRLMIIKR